LIAVFSALLRLIVLPLRAPMLLLLVVIAGYEGMHWGPLPTGQALAWLLESIHALLVVVVCTMPDVLLQQVSSLMAASRVMSLVITLLIVTVGGLYLLHLKVLANVLILACAVLLARLDLARVRIAPPPSLLTLGLGALVLVGASLGRWLAS
jgi:hypothetical protein